MSTTGKKLVIVGCGRLGKRIGSLWLQHHPNSQVTAETLSTKSHPDLVKLEFVVRTRKDADPSPSHFVLFVVPPASQQDYRSEAKRAVSIWNKSGALLFTSSTSVYKEENGGWINENSEVGNHCRTLNLLEAEDEIISNGGSVVRLGGLYGSEHGPHTLFFQKKSPCSWEDMFINLIHYDDAAALCTRILLEVSRGKIYLGSDGNPTTRHSLLEGMLKLHAQKPHFAQNPSAIITKNGQLQGRRADNSKTCQNLQWQPQWNHFLNWYSFYLNTTFPQGERKMG